MGRLQLLRFLFALIVLSLVLAGKPISSTQKASTTNSPLKRSSSAITITSDGTLVIAANPDSNSVSLIDAETKTLLVEIPVGIDPRSVAVDDTGGAAYVANRGSDSVSVVDLQSHSAAAEINVSASPYGLLASPDGAFLYVAEQGTGTVRVVDAANRQTVRRYYTGGMPSGLALDQERGTLYVSHLLSRRIVPIDISRPYQTFLPGFFGSPSDSRAHGETAILNEPARFWSNAVSPKTNIVGQPTKWVKPLAPSPQPLTHNPQPSINLFRDSNLVQSIVLSPDGQTAYIPHSLSSSGNPELTFETTVIPLVSLIDLENGIHLTGQQFDLGTLDPPGVGLPMDAAVTPDGAELWVVNAASNDVSVIDLHTRQLAAHIEVGDNPRGIVMAPDGQTAFVNNTLAGTVSIIDTAAYSVTQTITVTEIPLPPLLLQGKKLFNSSDDPRMSGAQWIACSSCHFDAGHDGRTWNFAFAGPRNTTSLLGMIETYPLRWSGEWDESADGEFAIRRENFGLGLIDGEMHCDLDPANCVMPELNQGLSPDLDALAAYMDSLAMPLSPGHRRGQPLTPEEERGQLIFIRPDLGCLACHPAPLYSDLLPHDVGTESAGERIGPAYDTPTLRGLYSSAPYFHDGSAATLEEALTRPTPGSEHDLTGRLAQQELDDLIRFLLALPYEQ